MGIQNGSKVSMNYSLSVDGVVVDSSEGREPLTYVQGAGEIIPALESKLEGLNVGEKKDFSLTPEEGYGQRSDEAIKKVPKRAFQDAEAIKVGSIVRGAVSGVEFQATVIEVGNDDITLDMNHPLAGKSLDFQIEIIEIN